VPYAYPLMLDLSDRLAVVIGGGAVAVRKVTGLLDAGAGRVRVAAPAFDPRMPTGDRIERLHEPYRPAHLEGAALAFAATDRPDVNDAVVLDARGRGILASRADEAGDGSADFGDFIIPAKLVEGPVVVGVSAGSAALAMTIRDGLRAAFDPAWRAMAEAMVELRPVVRAAATMDGQRRRDVLRALAGPDALDVARREGVAGVRRWLRTRYPELANEQDTGGTPVARG